MRVLRFVIILLFGLIGRLRLSSKTVALTVKNGEENSEEELTTPLPERFIWTDGDIEIIEP